MLTTAEIDKIDHVQNVTGGELFLPGFSEDGKMGITLKKDQVISVNNYLSPAAKKRCEALHKGIEGVPTGPGGAMKKWLKPVEGPKGKDVITTPKPGAGFTKTEDPQTGPPNVFDIKLLEEKRKEMADALETIEDEGQRAMQESAIDKMDEKIKAAKEKQGLPTDVDTNGQELQGAEDKKEEQKPEEDL
jgi:hypothetical protein